MIFSGMAEELKDQRISVMLTPSELKAVDDWSFDHRIRSRGEAIRQILQKGLLIDAALPSILKWITTIEGELDDKAIEAVTALYAINEL